MNYLELAELCTPTFGSQPELRESQAPDFENRVGSFNSSWVVSARGIAHSAAAAGAKLGGRAPQSLGVRVF